MIKKLKLGKMLYGVSLAALMSMSCLASEVIEEDRVTGLYYKGTSYQDATSHLPKSYVKDAMDDPLKAALQGVIDESYTRVVQPSFNGSKVFSLNQHRRVLSPLFYLVRRECETTNSTENLHKSIKHHMRTVWQQDKLRLPERDIDVFFQNMMPYTAKFLDIGREQRAPAERGINPEGRIIELYYTGASYQDAASHLPKGYVKDAMDDKLNAALQDVINESYAKVVQPSFKDATIFSLNQHRRVLSPLFYLVRRECETTNSTENLHKSIKHHMRTVWQQDKLRLPERDIDVFFQNMMPYTIKFLDIGREQRAPAARGINPEDRVTGLYYTGASYQDAASHLPKGYVKDAMDDKLNAALQDVINESYTRVVQPSFNGSKVFSLNQHRRVLSPLFYLVRRECETTNSTENLHKSIKHHMRTVWQQDKLRLPERDIDVFFQNMMPYTAKFLDIGREQRAPAERGVRGLIEDNLKQVLLKMSVNFDPHSETSLEALYNSEYKANLYVQTNGFRKSYEINRHTLFPLSIEVPLEGSLEALSFNTWDSYKVIESIGRAIIDNSTELEYRGRCFKNMEVKLSLGSSFLRVVDGHVIKKGSNQERPFSTTCVVENYEEV